MTVDHLVELLQALKVEKQRELLKIGTSERYALGQIDGAIDTIDLVLEAIAS